MVTQEFESGDCPPSVNEMLSDGFEVGEPGEGFEVNRWRPSGRQGKDRLYLNSPGDSNDAYLDMDSGELVDPQDEYDVRRNGDTGEISIRSEGQTVVEIETGYADGWVETTPDDIGVGDKIRLSEMYYDTSDDSFGRGSGRRNPLPGEMDDDRVPVEVTDVSASELAVFTEIDGLGDGVVLETDRGEIDISGDDVDKPFFDRAED